MNKLIISVSGTAIIALPFVLWLPTVSSGLPAGLYFNGVGRLFALWAFCLVIFQFLSISGIGRLEKDIGKARLVKIHKVQGVVILVLLLLHPALLSVSELSLGYMSPVSALKILGICALIILLISSGSALFHKRLHLAYKLWKRVHMLNYILFPLIFMHSYLIGSDLLAWHLKIFWIAGGLVYLVVLSKKIRAKYVQV